MISQCLTVLETIAFLRGLPVHDVQPLTAPWQGNKFVCEGVEVVVEDVKVRGKDMCLVSIYDL